MDRRPGKGPWRPGQRTPLAGLVRSTSRARPLPIPAARLGSLAVVLAALLLGCRRQEDYPHRPIMLICPWAAGGGTDRVSRQTAVLLEQELGVPVNVVNATGGAGVTGHTRGALARPDGYTLTMMTVELNMLRHRRLTNISYEDYQPVGLLNEDAAAIFVRSDSPWQTLADLDRAIRARKGAFKVSGTAKGGIWHLGFAGWLNKAGLDPDDAIWVSINGAAPSLQELMAGGVDAVCCSLPEARTLLESGQVRCLGVMADQRSAYFPDVPTFREQGIDWSLNGWRGVGLPRDTPPEITRRVVDALHRVFRSEAFQQYMRQEGFEAVWAGPEDFRRKLAEADRRFGQLLASPAFRSIQQSQFGPMFFPAVLAGLLGVVFLILLATGGLRRAEETVALKRSELVVLGGIILWVLAYIGLAEWIGFVVLAFVLLALLIWQLGTRLPLAVVVSAITVVICFQLFAVRLRVPLPRGWLESWGW